jgi:hypothetical protein
MEMTVVMGIDNSEDNCIDIDRLKELIERMCVEGTTLILRI